MCGAGVAGPPVRGGGGPLRALQVGGPLPGGGRGVGLGEDGPCGGLLGLPGVQPSLQLAVDGVVEEGVGCGLRGLEAGAEGGVGEPGVGVLEPLGGVLGGAGGVGGVREQRGPPLQLRGPGGDAVQGAPRPGQFLLQAGPFPVQPLPVPDPGGGPHGGLLPGGDAPFLLVPGLPQPFPRGVQLGGATAGLLVLLLQLLGLVGELSVSYTHL